MALKNLSITVDSENAGRVDKVVRSLSDASHSQVRGMISFGCVQVNDARIDDPATTVREGDTVSLRFEPTQRYREKKKQWDDRTFSIAFEDDHLIVVDKSAGVLTVPTESGERSTLVDRVTAYISHSRSNRDACVVHRLDRDISGLLVFGKHEGVGNQLIEQFKETKPERVYSAIVAGVYQKEEGTYRSRMSDKKRIDKYVTRKAQQTENAVTHYRVMERLAGATLIEAILETSWRNQLRAHFANAGHPVLGDPRYGNECSSHQHWVRKRLALHAQSLCFVHPVTGDRVECDSPLPVSFQKFARKAKPNRQ
ncbi:pseudouridine synthase [Planctomycetota bacterium]